MLQKVKFLPFIAVFVAILWIALPTDDCDSACRDDAYPYQKTIPAKDLFHISMTSGIAIDAGRNRLFVVEENLDRVIVVDIATGARLKIIGRGAPGNDVDSLHSPFGIAYDAPHDRLFVGDSGNNRVQVFDGKAYAYIATISGIPNAAGGVTPLDGSVHFYLDGNRGHLRVASRNGVHSFETATLRYIMPGDERRRHGTTTNEVLENGRAEYFATAGWADACAWVSDMQTFARVAYLGECGRSGRDNQHFTEPTDATVDSIGGNILVADFGNRRIQVFDSRTFAYVGTIKSHAFLPIAITSAGGLVYVASDDGGRSAGSFISVYGPFTPKPRAGGH